MLQTSGIRRILLIGIAPLAARHSSGSGWLPAARAVGIRRRGAESMTSPCQDTNTSLYAAGHDPWVYFQQEAPRCAVDDVTVGTLTSGPLASDIDEGTLPHAGMLIPNLQNDVHDGTLAQADSWLQDWMPRILAGPDFQSGRLAVVLLHLRRGGWRESEHSRRAGAARSGPLREHPSTVC